MHSLKRLALSTGLWFGLAFASQAAAQTYPEIDFAPRPSYLPNNVISLSFDDAPDWNNTARVLDVLKAKGVRASFFINGENWSSLSQDAPMRDLVRRIVAEGHELANHTSRHMHLGSLSPDQLRQEIRSVDAIAQELTGQRLTLLRAPFGEPYQLNNPQNPSQDYLRVAPIVAESAVHIGWHVDSFDYLCSNGQCVADNVLNKVRTPGSGDYGVVLLHSVHAQTVDGLPTMIDQLRNRGFQFWSIEDVVRARYGRSSAELVGVTVPEQPKPEEPKPEEPKPEQPKPEEPKPEEPKGCDAPQFQTNVWYEIGDQVVYEGQLFTAINERNPGFNPKVSTWFWSAGPLCN